MATQTIAVKIDQSLKMKKPLNVAVSGYWNLNFENAKQITTIVAISKQKVLGVFSASGAYLVVSGKDAGRVGFGTVVPLPQSEWSKYQELEPFSFRRTFKYL